MKTAFGYSSQIFTCTPAVLPLITAAPSYAWEISFSLRLYPSISDDIMLLNAAAVVCNGWRNLWNLSTILLPLVTYLKMKKDCVTHETSVVSSAARQRPFPESLYEFCLYNWEHAIQKFILDDMIWLVPLNTVAFSRWSASWLSKRATNLPVLRRHLFSQKHCFRHVLLVGGVCEFCKNFRQLIILCKTFLILESSWIYWMSLQS